MLSLILVMLVVWFAATVLLAAWTLFFQGYIYSEPLEHVLWRAPLAGTLVALFLALWVFLAYKTPGRYNTLSEFSPMQSFDPYKELTVVVGTKEEVFKLTKNSEGRPVYKHGATVMPSRPDRIIVTENGQKATFAPDRDGNGNFKTEPGLGLRYRDDKGRWMEEGYFGQVAVFRASWLAANLALNFVHLVVWFLVLWLVMQFQWSHALGQAIVFWLVTMLFIVPQLIKQAELVAGAAR